MEQKPIQNHNTQQIIDSLSDNRQDFKPRDESLEKSLEAKKRAILKLVGKIALLVLTLLCFARVPFVGSYLDGLFDYLLGFSKYIFYGVVIFILIGWIFNTGYTRLVKSKKFIVFTLLGIFSASCIVSGVTGIMTGLKEPLPFTQVMTDYHSSWLDYFKNWHYSGYFNYYVTGGILAEIVGYAFAVLSYVVLIIVALVVLIICILVILNVNYRSTRVGLKLRGWLVRKLGGEFKYDGYNELKASSHNQNKFKKAKRTEVEASAITNLAIPFDLLPETDLEKYHPNFKFARKIQNKLDAFFKNRKIDCVASDIHVYTAYTDICFEAKGKSQVNEIVKLQPNIAHISKLDHFNMTIRGNIVNIEVENPVFSKISMKSALGLTTDSKDCRAAIGIYKDSQLVTHNFRNASSALILGKKGSGGATLAVLLALSTCYVTTPDNLKLIVLNPNCEGTYAAFNSLPHSDGKRHETVNACVDELHEIQSLVRERNSLLRVTGVNNIDEYNKVVKDQKSRFKHVLVVISNLNSLLTETFQNNKIIGDILKHGRNAGVYLVMQSYVVNNDILDKQIYDNVATKYILALNSQEESTKIFNNYRGYQLHGNGDCLMFAENKISNMKRLQLCNINNNELACIVDIMKTFYDTKQKQKEADILLEANKNV